jgi:hypothetical protein
MYRLLRRVWYYHLLISYGPDVDATREAFLGSNLTEAFALARERFPAAQTITLDKEVQMGTRIIGGDNDGAAFYDSVTETAFGPIFEDEHEAEAFLIWLQEENYPDPRIIDREELGVALEKFREVEEDEEEEEEEAEEVPS